MERMFCSHHQMIDQTLVLTRAALWKSFRQVVVYHWGENLLFKLFVLKDRWSNVTNHTANSITAGDDVSLFMTTMFPPLMATFSRITGHVSELTSSRVLCRMINSLNFPPWARIRWSSSFWRSANKSAASWCFHFNMNEFVRLFLSLCKHR